MCLASSIHGEEVVGGVDKDAGQSNGEHQQQAERRPSAFAGDLTLDGLRVNQLKLSRNLTGTVLLSEDRFQIRAKVGFHYASPSFPCCSTYGVWWP